MKYTPSALVSEFSGAQGSTVASHNRFGPYFRNRVIPVNTNTLLQQNARNNLISGSQNWKALTAGQRAAFEAAAALIILYDALGRPYSPTGQQYYVSVVRNTYVYDPAAALPTVPPAAVPVAVLTLTPTAGAIAQSFSVAYTATPLAAVTKLLIEASPQLSAGISFLGRSKYRQILVTAAAAASPANIAANYIAIFGTILVGKRIFVRATELNSSGARSAPLATSLIVGA